MPSAQRTAQTVAAASHPLTNCPADGRADVGTARATTIATPAAPPRYLAVLFAPLPSPGWPGGADDTASCPSAAFARPVPTPVTSMPGISPDQLPAGGSCPSHSSPSRQMARPSASRCRVITRLGMRCACQATTALVVDHVASSAELASADQPSARSRKLGWSALASSALLATWSTTSAVVAWQAHRMPSRVITRHRLALGLAICLLGLLWLGQLPPAGSWSGLMQGPARAG